MPDYNIFIHSDPSISNGDRTKPWTSNQLPTTPKSEEGGDGKEIANAINTAGNPDGLIALGISKVAKIVPYVAVAFAGVSLLDKTVTTIQNFNVIRTGNQAGIIAYNNFKTNLKATFRPFSLTITHFQYQEQIKVERERVQLSQELLGESIINSRFGGRGV